MPTSSDPSNTSTWRTPCLTMTVAASAIGHSGAAVTTWWVMRSSTSVRPGSSARGHGPQQVALGHDAGPGERVVEHHGRAGPVLDHPHRRLLERVLRVPRSR